MYQSSLYSKENEHQDVVCVSAPFICVVLRAASRLRYGLNLGPLKEGVW